MMHRCLTVPEILAAILDAVPERELSQRRRKPSRSAQLAAMARACKLFYEPAMNALWSAQESLNALIKCLPSDTWENSSSGLGLMFTRGPIGDEWTRFLANAARVKKLHLGVGSDLHAAHLRTMRMYLPHSTKPFPNLRRLSFDRKLSLEIMSYLPILLNSKLQHFSMSLGTSDLLCSVLGYLLDQCPGLQSLSSSHWSTDSMAAVLQFKELRKLHSYVPARTPTMVSFFATAAYLTQLSISAPSLSSLTPNLSDSPTFPSLTSLIAHDITDILAMDGFLRLIPRDKMDMLILRAHSEAALTNTEHMKTLINTLSQFCTLTMLQILGPDVAEESVPPWKVTPLAALRSLLTLTISLPGYHWSTEVLRREVGTSWSTLKRIGLMRATAMSTIEILGDCALYLPRLDQLTLPIDASILPTNPVPLGRSTNSIHLELSECPIAEHSWPYIAAYIAAAYPNAYVSAYSHFLDRDDDGDEARLWEQVSDMVPIMAVVAKTERSLIDAGTIDVKPVF